MAGRLRGLRAGWPALVAVICAARASSAAPTTADLSAARQLFADAERDEDAGRWSEAMEKLRRVAQVRLTSGVRYHLALCEEHLGQLSRALDDFTAAQAQARADGAADVLRIVGKHLDDLGPRVPRLTVRVTPQAADLVVKLDDVVLDAAKVGTALAVDPGTHRVEASAPRYSPAQATVTVQERDVTSIDLNLVEPSPAPVVAQPPAAAPAAPAARPAAPEATPAQSTAGPRTGAIVATAGAAALAGLGVVAFVVAGNAVTSGAQQCATERTTSPCDAQKNTVRAWDFAAAGSWLGAAGVGAFAVVLWLRAPEGPSVGLRVAPTALRLEGSF